MRNRKTIMGFGLLAAVLFLAVGYAAISNIDFTITGTASAEVDTGLFEVAFDKNVEKTTTSNTGTTATVTATVTGDQSAEFGVTGLKARNETVTATYTIVNSSEDLDAELSKPTVTLSGDNTSFYDVTAVYGNGSDETPLLEAGDSITLTVTVKMKKTPIDSVNDVKSATINISFSADPVQPGSSSSGGSSSGGIIETEDPVYYGKHYIMDDVSGSRLSVVLYEDGSFEMYMDCILAESAPAGSIEIKDQQILMGGTAMGTVSDDKKTIDAGEDGVVTLLENGTCAGEYANLPMVTSAMNLLGIFEENNVDRQKVDVVTLENTISIPEGVTSFDVSYGQNGKVMVYVTPNGDDTYDMHIQGDGALYAPRNSSNIFSSSATEINNLNLLNTSYAVNMSYMFSNTEVSSLDLSNFDTRNVTDMSGMFAYTYNLTSLDLSSFDTSKVTDMSGMFDDAGYNSTEFTLNLGDNFDTSNVTDMSGMFEYTGYKSTEFTLNLGNNFDTSNVTDMNGMFYQTGKNSTKFTLNLGNNFDTSNVTDMGSMFYETGYNSSEFTLNLGGNFDTSNVTNMSYMFYQTGYNSTKFTLNLGGNFDTSNVTNMSYMFYQTGKNSNIFSLDCSEWNVDKVTTGYHYWGNGKIIEPTWKN